MSQLAPKSGEPGQKSDPDWTTAFLKLRTPLFNYFRRCGVAPQAAEDLVQAVFVKLLEQPDRFDPGRGLLESYVFGLARNLRRNQERRDRLRRVESARDLAEPAPGPGPMEIATVRQAVSHLVDEQREAIVLREFHGLSYDEIGRVQDVPVGTVRSRLARAREQLRRSLLEH